MRTKDAFVGVNAADRRREEKRGDELYHVLCGIVGERPVPTVRLTSIDHPQIAVDGGSICSCLLLRITLN